MYRAASWRSCALTIGREHTTGNRSARWLPGLEAETTTEIIDRVRWERGPDAAPEAAAIVWNASTKRWERNRAESLANHTTEVV